MLLVVPEQLLPPSICIICETQPDGEFVVDTLRNLKTGVASVFNGRKYVCERCVGEFAKLFGYEHGNAVQRAVIDLEFAYNELANVRKHVVELADHIRDFVQGPGPGTVENAPQPAQSPAETAVNDTPKPSFEDVFGGAPTPDKVTSSNETRKASPEKARRSPAVQSKSGGTGPKSADTGTPVVEAPPSADNPTDVALKAKSGDENGTVHDFR